MKLYKVTTTKTTFYVAAETMAIVEKEILNIVQINLIDKEVKIIP